MGKSAHINLSALWTLPQNPLFNEGNFTGEVAWNRVLSVTNNAAALDANATRDAYALRMQIEPLYRQVAGGLDLGVPIEPGRIFGEIAIFFNDRTRTQTVRCVTACSVMEINATTVHELFFQNPPFAFHLMELLAKRLRSDIQRASEDTLSG